MSIIEEFHLMNIDQRLLKAISDLKWQVPTDIQQAVIPLALEQKSLSVQARTGSGKTAAFAIPVIHSILQIKEVQIEQNTLALIIAPTKELCNQIAKHIKLLCKYASQNVSVIDVAQVADVDVLKPLLAEKPDIIIGTPFKILSQLHRKRIHLEYLNQLVVDEADLIFTFGYEKDIHELKGHLPKTSIQVILMSATLDDTVKSLRRSIRSGEWVRVELPEENFLPSGNQLTQYIISVEESSKYAILISMIRLKLIRGKTIIFTNSIDRCYKLKLFFEEFSVKSTVLNSELPVASRCHTVHQFNKGLYDYLLATDENESLCLNENSKKQSRFRPKDAEFGVSRGIDFQLVSNVINFDFPILAKQYVHRVGRTARADQMGTALSFVSNVEKPRLVEVANLLSSNISGSEQQSVDSIFKPYQFRMSEVDGFRYRSADIIGKLTRKRIREARLKEIKLELINSERLKGYFEDHSTDLDVLRHDKPLSKTVQPHLKDVPEYMIPSSLQALMHTTGKRSRYNQQYKLTKKHCQSKFGEVKSEPISHPKTTKIRRLRNYKTKMAIANNPSKLSQFKTQLARKRKASNPLFSFGKKKENTKKNNRRKEKNQ